MGGWQKKHLGKVNEKEEKVFFWEGMEPKNNQEVDNHKKRCQWGQIFGLNLIKVFGWSIVCYFFGVAVIDTHD